MFEPSTLRNSNKSRRDDSFFTVDFNPQQISPHQRRTTQQSLRIEIRSQLKTKKNAKNNLSFK